MGSVIVDVDVDFDVKDILGVILLVPRQRDAATIQGTGYRADRQGQAPRRDAGQGGSVQGASRGQSRQGDQGDASAVQDEGTATQGGQAAGTECGAAGGGLRVAGAVPDRDARHEAAPAAVAEDHGAGSDTKIPHRRAVGGRGGSRSASHGVETAEADDHVLGVDPQAGPVASALDAQATTTVHKTSVAAHEGGGDVCRRPDRCSKRSQAVRVPAMGSAAGSGDLRGRRTGTSRCRGVPARTSRLVRGRVSAERQSGHRGVCQAVAGVHLEDGSKRRASGRTPHRAPGNQRSSELAVGPVVRSARQRRSSHAGIEHPHLLRLAVGTAVCEELKSERVLVNASNFSYWKVI